MLTIADSGANRPGLSRRNLLHVGALALGGLSLPDLLHRQAAAGNSRGRGKSVIMIWQRGGPSHIDSFDMKPAAPPEIRGEFQPIRTNVPGIEICEHLPKLASMADRLAILRGIKSNDLGDHTPHYILTGFPDRGRRPTIGAVYSYLNRQRHDVPPYVSTFTQDYGDAHYTGPANGPFVPDSAGLDNLSLHKSLSLPRLDDRRSLLRELDTLAREPSRRASEATPTRRASEEFTLTRRASEEFTLTRSVSEEFTPTRSVSEQSTPTRRASEAPPDAFTQQAIDLIASPKAREAFDLDREPAASRERYGDYCKQFLLARRLVEAGVAVVTIKVGDWDTHEHNFRDMKEQLPLLDVGLHALVTDLHDRGLADDVAVVLWGEFGRAPRISRIAGRDHWPEAGAAVVAGGGFRVGQVIGETDRQAGQSLSQPYTPSNLFADLYRHLGLDPTTAIPDLASRPMHLLDDRQPVREL